MIPYSHRKFSIIMCGSYVLWWYYLQLGKHLHASCVVPVSSCGLALPPIFGLRSQIKHGIFILFLYRAITACHTLKHSFHDWCFSSPHVVLHKFVVLLSYNKLIKLKPERKKYFCSRNFVSSTWVFNISILMWILN